jgi:hypothetical protein
MNVLRSFEELKSVRSFQPEKSKFVNPKGVVTRETFYELLSLPMSDVELERWKSKGVRIKWR